MKILLVTGIFPPDSGGPASYVPRMAEALSRRGHHVTVVTLSDEPMHDDDARRAFCVHRIRRRLFIPWRLLLTVWTVWRLACNAEVVYVNGLGSEAALGALLAGRPAVHKIVGDYAWERARCKRWFTGTLDEYQNVAKSLRLRVLDFIRTAPLWLADRVITPSDFLRGIVAGWKIPRERIRVIYNAVPTPPRLSSPSDADKSPVSVIPPFDGKTAVTVCRLVPWKGVDALIRAVASIPGTRLVVVGDGYLRGELENLAASLGAKERILFPGHLPQAEVHRMLRSANVFALNSTYEGLPHVVLEAMAAGIPVVATRVGGTPEVVEHERTGLLVPAHDEAALREAIRRLLADPALAARLVAEAARRLGTQFCTGTMIEETEAELMSAAGRETSGRLSVLSLGCTRGLWDGPDAEDYQRMMAYAAQLDRYVIVANSYKRHRLAPRRLAPHVEAIPTNAFTSIDSFFRMLGIGARVLRSGEIGLVQAQDPFYYGLAAALLGWAFRVPVVICIFGPNVYDAHWLRSHWLHPVFATVGRRVLRRAHCIQVDGQLTRRSLLAAGHPDRQVAVKPVVPSNLASFLEIKRDEACPAEFPRLLYVGRLDPQKNLLLLLRAVKVLAARGLRFELLMVGDGPESELLRVFIRQERLGELVRLRGRVSRTEIPHVYAEADIFVLSSRYEGYPRVLMEAAAAALPIVSTAVSGADEAVLDGESGFLVPIDELDPYVEKLALLLSDADLRARMGECGRRHIACRLDPRTNAPAQLAIWHRVAGGHLEEASPTAPAAA